MDSFNDTSLDINLFGSRLKLLRDSKGMTLQQVAELVGLRDATLSRYENGKLEPKRGTIWLLADLFRVNPMWLAGDPGAKKVLPYSGPVNFAPVLGEIAAGIPILAQEDILYYEPIPNDWNVDFCLKVKGDSMIGARILNGDIVCIKQQSDVNNGEIAAVLVDGESATLKRVYKSNGIVILRAENPQYEDIIISNEDHRDVRILGKAVYFKSEIR